MHTDSKRVKRLRVDKRFDGDTGSGNGIYTEEAIAEIAEYLNSTRAYLNPKGGFLNSPMVETVELVLVGLMA